MTVVAVRKNKNSIAISCDRQTTWGRHKFHDSKEDMDLNPSKMWNHNDIIVGSSGSVSESTLFRIFTKTRKPSEPSVEGIIDYLVEFVDWAKKKDNSFQIGNHSIVIFGGRIFQAIKYDVSEVKDYQAVGSGMFLAIGAMYMGADTIRAVEVAKQFDLFCGGETDTIEIKIDEK